MHPGHGTGPDSLFCAAQHPHFGPGHGWPLAATSGPVSSPAVGGEELQHHLQ